MFPDDVLDELRRTIPERRRSAFVAEATRMKLLALKQKEVLARTAGAWSDEDYGDLSTDADMTRYRAKRDADWSRDSLKVAESGDVFDVPPRQ